MVGRRGEAPLVPPYILCNFKLDGAVMQMRRNSTGLSGSVVVRSLTSIP